MSRRLLLAAEIIEDVADTLGRADRDALDCVAAALRSRAADLAVGRGVGLELSPAMARLSPTIRRLAAALDPESEPRHDATG